jgi:hypothetical protein
VVQDVVRKIIKQKEEKIDVTSQEREKVINIC